MFLLDGKKLVADGADAIIILKLQTTGKYHVCLVESRPLPGQDQMPLNELSFLRYRMKMYHTEGSTTLEGARQDLANTRLERLEILENQVFTAEAIALGNAHFALVLPNWTKNPDRPNPFVNVLGPAVQ